jgi:tetratricopeptide (TPR) repeat protein
LHSGPQAPAAAQPAKYSGCTASRTGKNLAPAGSDGEHDALALRPDLIAALLGRADASHQLKRHEEALAAYHRALALMPDIAEAWLATSWDRSAPRQPPARPRRTMSSDYLTGMPTTSMSASSTN